MYPNSNRITKRLLIEDVIETKEEEEENESVYIIANIVYRNIYFSYNVFITLCIRIEMS